MLFNIFLSSLPPLTHKLLQNPNLNYLFQTLNLSHTLLNASNPQLAEDCWICLSITLLGDSALPTSILDWTTGNMSLHHSYCGEPLFISYLKYLHTSDQIGNSDILLRIFTHRTSLLQWKTSSRRPYCPESNTVTTSSFLHIQKFPKQFIWPTHGHNP